MRRRILSCLLLLPLIILVFAPVSCGKKHEQTPLAADSPLSGETAEDRSAVEEDLIPEEAAEPTGPESAAEQTRAIHRIRTVTLVPANPYAYDRLTVFAQVSPELRPDESLAYIFWINGERFNKTEQEENSIPPFSFEKGDSLFADVVLFRGEEELDRRRSDVLIVLNAKPEILDVKFPQIRGPGNYRITVSARDVDEDPLTFSLAADPGVPLGMEIDEVSGIITYNIDQPPDQQVSFRVIVSDSEGEQDWRDLRINFTRPTGQGEE